MEVVNCLKMIWYKPIMYENDSPLRKWVLISGEQVDFVQDIVVSGDTTNNDMGRK